MAVAVQQGCMSQEHMRAQWVAASWWSGAYPTLAQTLPHAIASTDHTPARALRHTALVCTQVLLEVMKRMDVLIFHFLINPPSDSLSEGGSSAVSSHQPDSPSSRDGVEAQQQVLRDTINPNMPMLDDSMLFFTRGVLTFGTGMNLKMACTR
jgi:hypothetical protein